MNNYEITLVIVTSLVSVCVLFFAYLIFKGTKRELMLRGGSKYSSAKQPRRRKEVV